jgi:hypothetical protein
MSSRRTLLASLAGLLGVGVGVAVRGDASSAVPPDGTYTAVVDRVEAGPDGGDLAVLVCERDGETVGDVVVERSALPEGGRHVDAVLTVEVADGDLVAAADRPRETERRARSAQAELDGAACDGEDG